MIVFKHGLLRYIRILKICLRVVIIAMNFQHSLNEMMRGWGIPGAAEAISEDYIQEICRCGAAELHSVASYMGGVAAQEVIKIVTGQYVPINNCYIFNGMKSSSTMLEV